MAITAISSFAIPDFSLGFTLRVLRFVYILLGFMAGFLGITAGLFVGLGWLSSLKSFGVSYLAPYLPINSLAGSSISYFIPPIWKRENRAYFLNTKKQKSQNKISMKWKCWKGN